MNPIPLKLAVTPLAASPGEFTATVCPACTAALDFHQPDPDLPGRILGVCGTCGAWFVLDLATAQIVHLPRHEVLGDAIPEWMRARKEA